MVWRNDLRYRIIMLYMRKELIKPENKRNFNGVKKELQKRFDLKNHSPMTREESEFFQAVYDNIYYAKDLPDKFRKYFGGKNTGVTEADDFMEWDVNRMLGKNRKKPISYKKQEKK